MKFVPYDYQRYAIDYLLKHPVAAAILDMGLGKTVITLTAIDIMLHDSFDVRKVLVVAPLRVARSTWPDEISRWDHLRHLRYSVVVGTAAERVAALRKKADIYIINRENTQWLTEESGVPFDYDMLVIDELSSFKNHHAKRFRALMKKRPGIKRVVGLTGTPAGNGLMDLWAEFRLLDMGQRLGKFIGPFRERYFRPDARNGMVVYSYKPLPGAEDAIFAKISDIAISMKASENLRMPDLVSTQYFVRMSEDERKRYDGLKKELFIKLPDGEITAANAAALSNKLCQMANGAVYGDGGDVIRIHERKLDALEDIVEAANGKPLLVAYWYRHDLQAIEERLRKLKVNFCRLDTIESIRRWNAGELQVALIHPASAGHGLNLQAGGSAMVFYSATWSLELYQQTVARLWRQGQKSGTVVVQHLVTEGTIDERIMRALKAKGNIQQALIDAVKAEVK